MHQIGFDSVWSANLQIGMQIEFQTSMVLAGIQKISSRQRGEPAVTNVVITRNEVTT